MAEQVRIDITADDKASKKIDQVADKVDDLESAKPKVTVDADTAEAQRDITDLLTKADKLASAPATLLLTSNAATIAREITDLTIELDQLDANDPTIDVKANQINALVADLDQVEAKLRDVNGTPVDIDTAPAKKGLDDVGKSADSSKSVLANMVGNTTQDLGALGGLAGSAGVAIGQMGEYIADAKASGEGMGSVLKSFAGVAAPIALIGLATKLISDHFAGLAEDTKVANDQMKRFSSSIQDGADEAQVLRDELEATSELKFRVQIEGPDIQVDDLVGPLAAAGLQLEDFVALSKLSSEELRRWKDGAEAAGLSSKDLGTISLGLAGYTQQVASATNNAANNSEVLGTKQQKQADAAKVAADNAAKLNAAYRDARTDTYAEAQQRAADAIDRVNTKLHEQADALNAQVEAAAAAADSSIASIDAQERFVKSVADTAAAAAELNTATKEHGANSKEAQAATDAFNESLTGQRDAVINAAKAAQRLAEDQAKASGTALTATQKVDAFNTSLQNNAKYAAPAAAAAVYDYLIQVNQIPPEKATEIRAAVAAGDLATADRLLDETSATRHAAVIADADTAAAERELGPQGLTRPRTVTINPKYGAALGVIGGRDPATGLPLPTSVGPPPAPLVGTVNLRLPVGWRGDPLAEVHATARRAGRFYHRLGR